MKQRLCHRKVEVKSFALYHSCNLNCSSKLLLGTAEDSVMFTLRILYVKPKRYPLHPVQITSCGGSGFRHATDAQVAHIPSRGNNSHLGTREKTLPSGHVLSMMGLIDLSSLYLQDILNAE